jgi:hypothetical protein
LVRAWKMGFIDRYVAPMLSHQSFGGEDSLIPRSRRRDWIQSNSAAVLVTDLYSNNVRLWVVF